MGYPGRCHGAVVWKASPLRRAILIQTIAFPNECQLLGDCSYPLEPFLMVPYRDNGFLSDEQRKFNTILSSTRVCVEQAFGILKKKFRILNYVDIKNIKLVKHIILSSVVLHNIIISCEGPGEVSFEYSESQTHSSNDTIISEISPERREAVLKRERLTNLLSA